MTWLKTFLELPNGIPSHDTIARIFASLAPSISTSFFKLDSSNKKRITWRSDCKV